MTQASRSRRIGLVLLIALAVLGLGAVAVQHARASVLAQQPGDPPVNRERSSNQDAPTISFIDSPTPQCSLPVEGTDACYINWSYLYVTTDASAYMISMTVEIDGQMRSNHQGFFQNYLYVPSDLLTPGLRVSCGTPGSGIIPALGKAYPFTIRARDSSNLKSANYGTVYCPGDIVPVKGGSLNGPTVGRTDTPYDFTVTSAPITATVPITYVWQVTDQPVTTVTNNLTDTRSFTWTTPGVKTLSVDSRNPAGGVNPTHSITIQVPVAGLSVTNNGPTALGSATGFSAAVSAGSDVTFTWDFGDGSSATGANVSHTYASSGSHNATVTANNLVSSSSLVSTALVQRPVSGLTASNNGPTRLGSPTQLTASIASGDSPNFTWEFGDGQSGSGASTSHTYLAQGTYVATVRAGNAVGLRTATTTVVVVEPVYYLYLPVLRSR